MKWTWTMMTSTFSSMYGSSITTRNACWSVRSQNNCFRPDTSAKAIGGDTFQRSAAYQATYSVPSKNTFSSAAQQGGVSTAGSATAAKQPSEMDYSSRTGRDDIGAYYNSVLEDFRANHSESEAMRLFDDFMRSEGYVLAFSDEYDSLPNTPMMGQVPASTGHSGPTYATISIHSSSPERPLPGLSLHSSEAYQLRSEMQTAWIDGKVEYLATSYGIMNADRQWTDSQRQAWQTQSEQVTWDNGIDTDAYLKNVADGDRRAVVGVNNDLGSMLSSALNAAGITLADDESLVISFPVNAQTGAYMGTVSTGRADVDAVINSNPDLLKAMTGFRDRKSVV